ncbi:MAG: hypothetical protein AAGB51_01220 [Planctomycetota bacterium]
MKKTDLAVRSVFLTWFVLATCLLLVPGGCEQAAEAPPEAEAVRVEAQPAAGMSESGRVQEGSANAVTAGAGIPGTIPDSWTMDPEPRQMRIATFLIPDVDGEIELAVTRFPGRVGGDLANVNRWRRQMGLDSVTHTELESVLARFESRGFDGYETRIQSDSGVLLAAAVYEQSEDRTWFVRVNTSIAAAARVEGQVSAFARSMAGIAQ